MSELQDYVVDAVAEALRNKMNEHRHAGILMEWSRLPNSKKKKWRVWAIIAMEAAASAVKSKE